MIIYVINIYFGGEIMGLASGGGGGGGGGGGVFFFGGDFSFGELVAGVGVIAVLFGSLAVLNSIDNKKILEQRRELQSQLAEDAQVKQFNLEYFDWMTENSEYFFTFSGSAMKMDNQPIDFLLTKYQVSQKNYYEMITYIEKNNIEGLDHKKGLFPKILEVVRESELVHNSAIEQLSSASYDKADTMIVLKDVKVPVVNKEKGTVSYLVQMAKYNPNETEQASIDFITKRVTVPLTKDLENCPTLAYLVPKENCKVKTVKTVNMQVQNYDYVVINNKSIGMEL